MDSVVSYSILRYGQMYIHTAHMYILDSSCYRCGMTSATIAERVQRGAAFLDENFPDWTNEIDLRTLDLSSGCACILGQKFGDFISGSKASGLVAETSGDTMMDFSSIERWSLAAHGFLAETACQSADEYDESGDTVSVYDESMYEIDNEYDKLTTEWMSVVLTRRLQARAQTAQLVAA